MATVKRQSLFRWVLLLVFFKGVVWAAFVPMWHFPDEQAHFAQVQYLAELGRYPTQFVGETRDLSEEVFISEQFLGTDRENGINKFTYHPEYRIPYTDTTIGLYEAEIANLPVETRYTYVKYEAANYPPFYYLTTVFPYRLFYSADLFVRVFSTRIFNLLYVILFAVFTWKIASMLFGKKEFYAAAFTLFVNFQPMFTFVSSGITSDNAMNLWYAIFIYFGLKLLYTPLTRRMFLIGAGLVVIGPFIKQQSVFMLPLFLLLFFYALLVRYRENRRNFFKALSAILIIIVGMSIFLVIKVNAVRAFFAIPLVFDIQLLGKNLQFLRWTAEHTIREVLPWYWGVFNWLGVVLPRLTNRIIIRLMGIAVIGFLIIVVRRIRFGSFRYYDKAFLFLGSCAVLYFLALTFWDFIFFSKYNYSFGIQGRYFFPTIIAHMAFLIWGFRGWVSDRWGHYWPIVFYVFVFGMIVLNFQALYVVLSSYYSFESTEVFFNQASQYKPALFKFPYLLMWISLYAIFLLAVLSRLFSHAKDLYQQTKASPPRSATELIG